VLLLVALRLCGVPLKVHDTRQSNLTIELSGAQELARRLLSCKPRGSRAMRPVERLVRFRIP
jgi:hypothetical protein